MSWSNGSRDFDTFKIPPQRYYSSRMVKMQDQSWCIKENPSYSLPSPSPCKRALNCHVSLQAYTIFLSASLLEQKNTLNDEKKNPFLCSLITHFLKILFCSLWKGYLSKMIYFYANRCNIHYFIIEIKMKQLTKKCTFLLIPFALSYVVGHGSKKSFQNT